MNKNTTDGTFNKNVTKGQEFKATKPDNITKAVEEYKEFMLGSFEGEPAIHMPRTPQELHDWLTKTLTDIEKEVEERVRGEVREWAKEKKSKLVMKWDRDKAQSTVYDSIIFGEY